MSAIEIQSLRKVYPAPRIKRRTGPAHPFAPPRPPSAAAPDDGGDIVALDRLDLAIDQGEFFGLLGPNGAGKTTTIGVLTTRVRPTSGQAFVHGHEVVRDAVPVRQMIGVVPQRPNPDRMLTVAENLLFHASYFGVPRRQSMRRCIELLETFGLADRSEARTDQLSGGQQQRLMIARALMHEPAVLFLDEPTVGLDPQARLALWDILRSLHQQGRTIVMTTHYMEEADQLCDRIAIIDRGRLLALDTPGALKVEAPGGTLIELTLDGPADPVVPGVAGLAGVVSAAADGPVLRVYAERAGEVVTTLIMAAAQRGRAVTNIHLAEPSLETLFVSLTGRKLD